MLQSGEERALPDSHTTSKHNAVLRHAQEKLNLVRGRTNGARAHEYSDKTGTRRWDMGLENFIYDTTVNGKEVKVSSLVNRQAPTLSCA